MNSFIYVISDCFYATTAEFCSYKQDSMVRKAKDIYNLAYQRKSLLISTIEKSIVNKSHFIYHSKICEQYLGYFKYLIITDVFINTPDHVFG